MKVLYAVEETILGLILLAASENGVCSIQFGDSKNQLIANINQEFPLGVMDVHSGELRMYIDQITKYLGGEISAVKIPLDVRSTTFRLKVWEELGEIPYGQTRSYSKIAEAIGQPKAVRAVASACAANSVAIAIPCHRVVHADGSISGYRWGLKKKEALLELEKKNLLSQ